MSASYRLQFNRNFTFKQAIALIPYLKKLGISYCYSSPLLKARKGSDHGYDVVDYQQFNPEIGTLEEFKEMVQILKAYGIALIFDFVPNHMCILDPDNRYWYDVLKNGQNSEYAKFFDINWKLGILILPFLEKKNQDPEEIRKKYQFPDSPHYKLIFWEKGYEHVNYRRFFDTFHYAALAQEKDVVFDETHRFLFQLIDEKLIDFIRVDHIDGLKNPEKYLQKLQKKCSHLFVEKILLGDERIRKWPILGTTGYDFLTRANALFVDSKGKKPLATIYRDFTKKEETPTLVYQCKKWVLENSFLSELKHLSENVPTLKEEIKVFLCSFDVYRTYITDEKIANLDVEIIEKAFAKAKRYFPKGDFEKLRKQFSNIDFIERFQLTMSPLSAKGLEDTALYDYFPLSSLNDVGYNFSSFGSTVNEFHEINEQMLVSFPQTLLASTTHDTKRSEDVRARIHVLSEIPQQWKEHLKLWSSMNPTVSNVPEKNEQYLLYQTLFGTWPFDEINEEYIERIQKYMEKAAKEEKIDT